MLSSLIILGSFIGVVLSIISDKINRAVAAQIGAVITYFTLIFLEKKTFSLIVELLFGSESDGYVNLHSLIIIIGIHRPSQG